MCNSEQEKADCEPSFSVILFRGFLRNHVVHITGGRDVHYLKLPHLSGRTGCFIRSSEIQYIFSSSVQYDPTQYRRNLKQTKNKKHTKYRNKLYSNLKQIVFLLRRRLWKLFPCLNELQATVAEMNHRKEKYG